MCSSRISHQHDTLRPTMKFAPFLACLLTFYLAACSTNFYSYSAGKPITGTGGASKKVDGIDLWIEGTPPRKFQIIGVIHDNRPGRGVSMLLRDGHIAGVAKQQGGDGVLLSFDERETVGSITSGNAYTTGQATAYKTFGGVQAYGSASTSSTSISQTITRRNSKFYVIRYL